MDYLEHDFAFVPVHFFGYFPVGFNKTVIIDALLVDIALPARKDIGIAGYDQSDLIFCKLFIKVSEPESWRSVFFSQKFVSCGPDKVVLEFQVADVKLP